MQSYLTSSFPLSLAHPSPVFLRSVCERERELVAVGRNRVGSGSWSDGELERWGLELGGLLVAAGWHKASG